MKFKKHISLLLVFFLLVSNMGLAFNVHYCGNEVAAVEAVYYQIQEASSQKKCCGEKIEKEKGCCRSVTLQFQDKSENNLTKPVSVNKNILVLKEESKCIAVFYRVDTTESSAPVYHYQANSPPFFKLYHQYIFYG